MIDLKFLTQTLNNLSLKIKLTCETKNCLICGFLLNNLYNYKFAKLKYVNNQICHSFTHQQKTLTMYLLGY